MADGLAPAATPVGDAMHAAVRELGDTDLAGVRLRASDALRCARWLGFRMFGTPSDIADDYKPEKRSAGDAIDRAAKKVLAEKFGADVDVHFDLLPDVPLGGVGDAMLTTPLGLTAGEIKSSSTGKLMGVLGNWRNTPAGPEAAWVVQAALLAIAKRAAAVQVWFFSNEDLQRKPAEWLIGMDDPLVHLPAIKVDERGEPIWDTPRRAAIREARRQQRILQVVAEGRLPRRELPGYGLVQFPPSMAQEGADPWQCRFCVYQPTCSKLPADEIAGFVGGLAV